jgi:hypothetical protein
MKGKCVVVQPSERLQKVLSAGDVLALFPLLKDWPTDELQALLKDIEEYTAANYDTIDREWEKFIFQPAAFFDQAVSRKLGRVRDEKKMEVMAVMSEICSVAILYLERRGVEVALPELEK